MLHKFAILIAVIAHIIACRQHAIQRTWSQHTFIGFRQHATSSITVNAHNLYHIQGVHLQLKDQIVGHMQQYPGRINHYSPIDKSEFEFKTNIIAGDTRLSGEVGRYIPLHGQLVGINGGCQTMVDGAGDLLGENCSDSLDVNS